MEKENNIKISIIIPIYNAEKYLEKCIESIIVQNLKEIEIICVNDGSIDNSLKILEKLSKVDERIIIINQKNSGASKARNSAIKVAKGKYCLNIDSDDWIEQGYLKDIYERAERDELDIAISDIIFDFIDNSDKNYIISDLKIDEEKIITGKEYIKRFFNGNTYGYTWNKLIRRELYIKNNLFYDEDIFLMEDTELLIGLSYSVKKIGKLNKAYYHYCQTENNGSYKMTVRNLYDILTCMNKLIIFYEEREEKEIVELLKESKFLHLMNRILGANYSSEKEKYKKFLLYFIKNIKNEKKLTFSKKNLDNRYKKILIILLKMIKNSNIKIGILSIEIAKKIIFLKEKIKNIRRKKN